MLHGNDTTKLPFLTNDCCDGCEGGGHIVVAVEVIIEQQLSQLVCLLILLGKSVE